jgi:tRNA (guanine26-N2/guanine27-N2)-dimethyltransferase
MIYYCGKCANSHVERFGHYDEKKKTYMPNKVSLSSLVCNICGGSWTMNGPVWLDALNDEEFVRNLISNFDAVKKKDTTHSNWPYLKNLVITKTEEINGIIRSVYQEVPVQNNTITWDLTNLFGFVKVGAPKNNMVHAAFHNAGYLYCQSYQNPKGIKTNAPNSFIFDLVKEWVGGLITLEKNMG